MRSNLHQPMPLLTYFIFCLFFLFGKNWKKNWKRKKKKTSLCLRINTQKESWTHVRFYFCPPLTHFYCEWNIIQKNLLSFLIVFGGVKLIAKKNFIHVSAIFINTSLWELFLSGDYYNAQAHTLVLPLGKLCQIFSSYFFCVGRSAAVLLYFSQDFSCFFIQNCVFLIDKKKLFFDKVVALFRKIRGQLCLCSLYLI